MKDSESGSLLSRRSDNLSVIYHRDLLSVSNSSTHWTNTESFAKSKHAVAEDKVQTDAAEVFLP